MMHHVHTGEAVVTRPKIDIFWACHHEAHSARDDNQNACEIQMHRLTPGH